MIICYVILYVSFKRIFIYRSFSEPARKINTITFKVFIAYTRHINAILQYNYILYPKNYKFI